MLDTMTSTERSYRKTRNEFSGLNNQVTGTRSQDSGYGQLKHMLVLLCCTKKQALKGNLEPLHKIVQKLAFCFLISSSQQKLVIDLPRHWIMALTLSGLKHTDAENDFCLDND